MPLQILFLSGPRGAGKTTLAKLISGEVLARPVHYVRMRPSADGYTNAVLENSARESLPGMESKFTAQYTADRAFETVPEALRSVKKREPSAFTIIEADTDPSLRHAYPYDFRVFVAGPPETVETIFRSPSQAATALHDVMQDTAAFASEIFGLGGFDEPHREPMDAGAGSLETLEISDAHVREFLHSPLGAEVAARIQLQPEYAALVEADVGVINTPAGKASPALRTCIEKLEQLLIRIRQEARRQSVLYWGDLADTATPTREKLLARLRLLLSG